MITTLRPKTFTSSFEMQPLLSDTEIELLSQLREVKHDSLWGSIISEVVHANKLDIAAFRNLVCQLQSQAHDSAMVMQKIIGVEAYQSLMDLA